MLKNVKKYEFVDIYYTYSIYYCNAVFKEKIYPIILQIV